MGVPKQKHTKSRRDKRRMHIHLQGAALVKCPKCGKPKNPHAVCPNCGFYKGREVVDVMKKLTKKEKKMKEKEMSEQEKEEKEKPLTMEGMSKSK
jgi:large subunit ribosomal protein L32